VTPVVAAAESEQPLGVSYETVLPTLSVEELTSPQEAHSAIDKSIVPDMESLPTEQKAEPKSEPDNEDNSQVAVAHSADTPTDSGTAKNFCQQCGTAVEEGCAFCGECGMPQNQT
jgi:membrane protease subunit (stomatin/prohibitin family)